MTRLGRPGVVRLTVTPLLVAAGLLALYLYVTRVPGRPLDDVILTRSFLMTRLQQHVELVVVSFGLATVVALPLGILIAQSGRRFRIPVLLVANLGQAVPSVAILALIFTVLGFTFRTTVVALVLYAILPILRNAMVGVQGVDEAAVEAARGMGMTPLQALLRVQLPLASPVIFAGLRTALVLVVGTATLGNFVGGGGLGDVIQAGLTAAGLSPASRIVVVGAAMVAALALLFDWALGIVEQVLSPRT